MLCRDLQQEKIKLRKAGTYSEKAKKIYARFRAAYEGGFYPLYEKPPGALVDFYLGPEL